MAHLVEIVGHEFKAEYDMTLATERYVDDIHEGDDDVNNSLCSSLT